MIEDRATVHMSEAEVARDLHVVLAKVQAGLEVIVERDHRPVAVNKSPQGPGRKISECIALAQVHKEKTGDPVCHHEDCVSEECLCIRELQQFSDIGPLTSGNVECNVGIRLDAGIGQSWNGSWSGRNAAILHLHVIRIPGHDMKGSGAGFGFAAITEIGSSLEAASKKKSNDQIRTQILALRHYLECLEVVSPPFSQSKRPSAVVRLG